MLKKHKFSKKEIKLAHIRARGCCEYCKIHFEYSNDSFHLDHILPFVLGGFSSLSNIAFACGGCNKRKYIFTAGIDPMTGFEEPLFNPRLQNWDVHFEWAQNFTLIFGKSPIGRATIQKLELNRSGLVNLRKALFVFGVHPFV